MAALTMRSAESNQTSAMTDGNWQPLEVQLLLHCARTHIDLITADEIELFCCASLNWQRVLDLAATSDVTGLLHQSLSDVCPDAVPSNILTQLAQPVQTATLNSVFFTQELLRVFNHLNHHNIPALAYKGPALAISLYGSLALRPFCDVDILIQPEHLVAVKALLGELGYDTLVVNDRLETANTWSDTERDFIRQDGKVVLDLHWRITPRFFPFELPVSDLWQRRQPVSLLGETIPTLAPEDLLLCLCVHGAKECWGKLKWICDVAELLREYPTLDWEVVWQRAEQFHSLRSLRLGLALAAELLGAKLPEDVQSMIDSDRAIPLLIPQVYGYLFGILPPSTRRLSPTVFRLWVRDRWQDRVQYFVWRIFIPNVRDRQIVVLPQWLSFLYYLIRPLRLIGEKLGLIQRPILGEQSDLIESSAVLNRAIANSVATTNHPRRKNLDMYDLGEELLIYSEEQELGITLNLSSKQIWQLCDGTRNLDEIASAIAQQLDCNTEALLEDVCNTILQFHQLGLLESQ